MGEFLATGAGEVQLDPVSVEYRRVAFLPFDKTGGVMVSGINTGPDVESGSHDLLKSFAGIGLKVPTGQ